VEQKSIVNVDEASDGMPIPKNIVVEKLPEQKKLTKERVSFS